MTVKLQTEQYLGFLSLKGGCSGLSESILIKIPHCWKSRATVDKGGRINVIRQYFLPLQFCNTKGELQQGFFNHFGSCSQWQKVYKEKIPYSRNKNSHYFVTS